MTDQARSADVALVIGRFQPFHHGHAALVTHALEVGRRALLVLGSAGAPRSAKNPFTAPERVAMIRASFGAEQQQRLSFVTVRDYYDERRWANAVTAAVAAESAGPVALVGFRKDDSSAYLSLFPEWREHSLPRQAPIDGTALRRLYLGADGAHSRELDPELVRSVPPAVAQFLEAFRHGPELARLQEEFAALEHDRERYGRGPFVTVDAVVTRGSRILLVQRGRAPGKGLWALPGGFLEGSELLLTAAIRELREETLVDCSEAELRASFRGARVFDHPQRSQRGRTITHAHHFDLAVDGGAPPQVQGADDARAARWFEISEIPGMLGELFDDHFQIIDRFFGLTRD
jgi:bifunctional NMN adenylyltransferase/nudix hydrolase